MLLYGMPYGMIGSMKKRRKQRKVTVVLPEDLLELALAASGDGLTPTLRRGLELVAAQGACKRLLSLKGQLDLGLDPVELRKDRDE